MIDSKSGFSQVSNGTDTRASAPYKRAQAYTEEKVCNGLMWMDLIPGIHNPSDMASKQPKSVPDFEWKNGVLSGSSPTLFESAEVIRIKCAASAGSRASRSAGLSAVFG